MKKISKAKRTSDGMRVEYDFSGGVRGKYAARYRAGTNVVMLDPDVAATFKDADPVTAPPFEAHTFPLDVLWPFETA